MLISVGSTMESAFCPQLASRTGLFTATVSMPNPPIPPPICWLHESWLYLLWRSGAFCSMAKLMHRPGPQWLSRPLSSH